MRTSVWVAPVASVVILFGTIGVADALGAWHTTGRQMFGSGQGQGGGSGGGGGESGGGQSGGGRRELAPGESLAPDDLRGWMTLGQAADGLGLDREVLIGLVGAPEGVTLTPDTAFRDVEGLVPGFELGTFRETVRRHLAEAPR